MGWSVLPEIVHVEATVVASLDESGATAAAVEHRRGERPRLALPVGDRLEVVGVADQVGTSLVGRFPE